MCHDFYGVEVEVRVLAEVRVHYVVEFGECGRVVGEEDCVDVVCV